MLPTEDASWVGEELTRRFGLPLLAVRPDRDRRQPLRDSAWRGRSPAGRRSWSTPGATTAPSTRAFAIEVDGETRSRPDNIGPPVDPAQTTRAVEWNDVDALERALAAGDVACVLAEPAMTNIGIVLPDPGYHDALRDAHPRARHPARDRRDAHDLRRAGRLHRRRRARAGLPHDRQGDRRRDPGRRLRDERGGGRSGHRPHRTLETSDVGGIGGTLSGNALSLAAMRATLEEVLTDDAFDHMIGLARALRGGRQRGDRRPRPALARHPARLPGRVPFRPTPPRNGGEATAADDASSTATCTCTRSTAGSC